MRQKLLLTTAGTAFLMLTSCSADEPVAQNTTDGAIKYSVATDNQSRALHSYCTNNMPALFKVWAYLDKTTNKEAELYINGDKISKGNNSGSYADTDGIRYWPSSRTLSFFAFADLGGIKPVVNNGEEVVVSNYTVTQTVSQQPDLMYAVTRRAGATDNNNTVALNFRHALCQVCFKAKNENANQRITIKSVTVGGLYDKGTYTINSSVTTDGNINTHDPNNTNDIGDNKYGQWSDLSKSDLSEPGKYTINLNPVVKLEKTDGNAQNLTCYTDNAENPTSWGNVLNLIPQQLNPNEDNKTNGTYFRLKIKVENKVEHDDNTVSYQLITDPNKNNSGEDEGFQDYIICTDGIEWQQGTRYIYTFSFNTLNNLKTIEYNVTTDDFSDAAEGAPLPVNPPVNTIINGYEAVLMRSGSEPLYFATTNIGAPTKEDFGNFFWWGETGEGHIANDDDNDGTYTTDFQFSRTNEEILTNKPKADIATNFLSGEILKSEKDAATQNWGTPWRMPTVEELEWLKKNCTWEKEINADGKLIGVKVTSKTTGGEIYLPATGCFQGKLNDDERFRNMCWYWSSTIGEEASAATDNDNHAYRLKVSLNNDILQINISDYGYRWNGFPIRPVATPYNN